MRQQPFDFFITARGINYRMAPCCPESNRAARSAPAVRSIPACRVVAGGYFTCALECTGEVICWGYNSYGQLGIGSTTDVGTAPGQMGIAMQAAVLPPGASLLACLLCESENRRSDASRGPSSLGRKPF